MSTKSTVVAPQSELTTNLENHSPEVIKSVSDYPELLTCREVAKLARVKERTIRRWYSGPSPALKPIKIHSTIRFHKANVMELLGLNLEAA